MRQKFFILFAAVLSFVIFSYLWFKQASQPPNRSDSTPTIFSIKRDEPVRSVAERLQKQDLVRSALAFFLIARFGDIGNRLQAGEFRLNPSMDLYTVGETLTHGTMDVWITIPEGWRNEEIAQKLAKDLSIPESEFIKEAKQGYMFPDTYLFPKDATVKEVIEIFSNNFNQKVNQRYQEQASKKGLTLDQLLTVSSLVEREARVAEDRPLVASVILNRLEIGMKLDIDATVQYALGYQEDEKTWWKKNLTRQDLEVDSPYNTYKNNGLPPGPIANPGLAAIKAVVDSPQTDYLYYVSDKSGKNHYAETIEEHQANISRYLK